MSGFEIFLIGAALSMDAFAVSVTNGIDEPEMSAGKWFSVAFAFALFQFGMPLLGYYGGSAFSSAVGSIAPWLSFAILGLIGGKTVVDYIAERVRGDGAAVRPLFRRKARRGLTAGKLFAQAIATSLDALAVGITFLAAETAFGLPFSVTLCAALIGSITFCLSAFAVGLGKKAGDRFSDEAWLAGGVVLIVIGLKILLEAVL